MIRHRRCAVTPGAYTAASGYVPPACVMCGKPVGEGQSASYWYAPHYPEANGYGRVSRHAQATTGGPLLYRFDRKWGRAAAPRKDQS